MLVSEKQALFQLLAVVGTSPNVSGWAVFFRNGSSNNVPRSFVDLVATSRCAVEYKYQTQVAESSGNLVRQFTRGRSLTPIGGYGQGRVVLDPVTKQNIQTYAVFPEYCRYTPTPGWNKTPQQVLANVSAASDVTQSALPSWDANDTMEYDYGRTLRFRSFFIPNAANINVGNIRLEYQDPTTLVWTRIVVVSGPNDNIDITARKLRISMNGGGSGAQILFTPYAERGSEFVVATLTHAVLVPLTVAIPSGVQAYLNQVPDDYYGLVLDLGTDLVAGTTNIGQYGQMAVPDLTIRFVDNFLEGV